MAEHQYPPLKIIAGADDFGCSLKDALVAQLRSLDIEVEDLGTSKYYSIREEVGRRFSQAAKANSAVETRGLVACGTGVELFFSDYLFTPAGDVHRVKYFEDTEFFITWDGHWDIFLNERCCSGQCRHWQEKN